MYWNSSVMQFLIVYIVYLIPASEVHKNSSLLVTSGLTSIKMFVTKPEPVYSFNDPKFTDIPGHPWVHSRHQIVDLKIFIQIQWVPLPPSNGFTYLLTCINHFTKLCQSATLQQRLWHRFIFKDGFLDLVFHQQLSQTEGNSLSQCYGTIYSHTILLIPFPPPTHIQWVICHQAWATVIRFKQTLHAHKIIYSTNKKKLLTSG